MRHFLLCVFLSANVFCVQYTPDPKDFLETVETFIKEVKKRRPAFEWLNKKVARDGEYIVCKLELSSNARVTFFSDIHAHSQALADWVRTMQKFNILDGYKLKSERDYLIFMGDYVDRGSDGVTVLNLVLNLFIHNPGKVFVLRGNHEEKSVAQRYQFDNELKKKYGFSLKAKREKIYELFDYLLSACFLIWTNSDEVTRGFFCSHASFPETEYYSPEKLLKSGALYQAVQGKDVLDDAETFSPGGIREFFWGDFVGNPKAKRVMRRKGKAFARSKEETEKYFQKLSFATEIEFLGIIRGHQHGSLGRYLKEGHGIHFLWRTTQWDGQRSTELNLKELWRDKEPIIITLAPFNYASKGFPIGSEVTWFTLNLNKNFEKCRFRAWVKKKPERS